MTSWNEIPYDSSAPAEVKAQEFDLQYAENQAAAEVKNAETPWFPQTPEEKK